MFIFVVLAQLYDIQSKVTSLFPHLGDSLKYHNEMEFRTTDYDVNGCASAYKNGWWFRKCHAANLNGAYRHDGGQLVVMDKNKNIGIQWQDWKGRYYSLKTVEMKIKRL